MTGFSGSSRWSQGASAIAVALLLVATSGAAAGAGDDDADAWDHLPEGCEVTHNDITRFFIEVQCPLEQVSGYTRVDVEADVDSELIVMFFYREADGPGFRVVQGWKWEDRNDSDFVDWTGHAMRAWGFSDYERTVVKVGDVHYEEEKESSRNDHDEVRGVGSAADFGPGAHSFFLIYAWHDTANVTDTRVVLRWTNPDVPAPSVPPELGLAHYPGKAWLFEDRDFDPTVQARQDGRYNVIFDSALEHSFEHTATGTFFSAWWTTLASAAVLGVDGPRPCKPFVVTAPYPAWLLRPAPPGEYRYSVDAKAEAASRTPSALLLLADLDVPVQQPQYDLVPPYHLGEAHCDEDLWP